MDVMTILGIAVLAVPVAWMAFKAVSKMTKTKKDDEWVEKLDPWYKRLMKVLKEKTSKTK